MRKQTIKIGDLVAQQTRVNPFLYDDRFTVSAIIKRRGRVARVEAKSVATGEVGWFDADNLDVIDVEVKP